MTVVDRTPSGESNALTFELELAHPPAKVWRALTDPELLSRWLLPVLDLKLEPGAAFTFKTQPYPPWDGVVHCKVLEVEVMRQLRYSWVVGDMELDTVVTFTIEATSAGTRLSLVQSGFKPAQKQNFGGARYGWRMMSGKLVDVLAELS